MITEFIGAICSSMVFKYVNELCKTLRITALHRTGSTDRNEQIEAPERGGRREEGDGGSATRSHVRSAENVRSLR